MQQQIEIDWRALKERAWAHAKLMYADDDPRQYRFAAEYEHRQWLKMVTPPIHSQGERIERLLTEIRDLLLGKE